MNIKKSGTFTTGDVHVNTALTNLAVAYIQDVGKFIASQVFPEVPVKKQSDKIMQFDKNDYLRVQAQKRAPGTESAGGGFAVTSNTTYFCDIHAFHQDIPEATLSNSDIPNLDIAVTEFVTQQLLLERERDFVSNFFTTGVWGTDATGTASSSTWPNFIQWSDTANSTPLEDIRHGKRVIQSSTGFTPNTLVVSREVHDYLVLHPDIKDLIKYTRMGIADAGGYQMMADLFGVDRYIVGETAYASNTEGASEAYNYNFGKGAMLAYVPQRPQMFAPASGYIFSWTGFNNLGYNVSIDKWYIREIQSWRIEGEMAYDAKVIGSDLGLFFSSATA